MLNQCIKKDISFFTKFAKWKQQISLNTIEMGRYLHQIFPDVGVRFIATGNNFDTLTNSSSDLSVSMRMALNDVYTHDSF
jgi:hypothetical protein